eukprot:671644-Prymnesium_polylepis.1
MASHWRCPYGHKCQFAHGKEELRCRQMNEVQQRAQSFIGSAQHVKPIWPPLPDGPPPSTCLMLPTPYALIQPPIPFGPPAFKLAPSVPPLPPGPPPPLSQKTQPDSLGVLVTVPPSVVGLPHSSSSVSEHAELEEFEDLLRSSAMYLSDVSTLGELRESRVR